MRDGTIGYFPRAPPLDLAPGGCTMLKGQCLHTLYVSSVRVSDQHQNTYKHLAGEVRELRRLRRHLLHLAARKVLGWPPKNASRPVQSGGSTSRTGWSWPDCRADAASLSPGARAPSRGARARRPACDYDSSARRRPRGYYRSAARVSEVPRRDTPQQRRTHSQQFVQLAERCTLLPSSGHSLGAPRPAAAAAPPPPSPPRRA